MKFAAKLTTLILSIVIASVLIIASFVYFSNVKTLEGEISSKLEHRAVMVMSVVDRFMDERLTDIRSLSTRLELVLNSPNPEKIQRELIDYRNVNKNYISISYFDLNGVRIADTSGIGIGGKEKDSYWDKVIGGQFSVAEYVELSHSLGVPVIYFASPVYVQGKVSGVLAARVGLLSLGEIVQSSAGTGRESGYIKIDLIDKNGLLLYSNYNRPGILKDKTSHFDILGRISAGEKNGSEWRKLEGRNFEVFAVEQGYLDFAGNGWALVINVPLDVVFAPVNQLRDRLTGILLILIVFSILAVIFFSRSFSVPIARLSRIASQIGFGNYGVKIDVESKDEIGQLSETFKEMTSRVKQKQAEILQEKAYADSVVSSIADSLIVINFDSTIKNVNKAFCDLLGYSEKELIGKPVGTIFSETVETVKAEETAEIEEVLNAIDDAAMIISRGFKIIKANNVFLDTLGVKFADVIGESCYKITHNQDDVCAPPQDICPVSEVIKTNKPRVELHTHYDKKGNIILVNVAAAPILDSLGRVRYYLHLARKTGQEKEKDIFSLEKKVSQYAEKLAVIYGRYIEKISQKNFFSQAGFKKLIKQGSVREFEMIYRAKNGEKIPVSFSGSVMYEAGDRESGIVNRESADDPRITIHESRSTTDERRIIGFVGIARDMRRTKSLVADLESTKMVVEDYARNLEQKIAERTKDLADNQEATLNIMEDIQESKEELEKRTVALEKAKAEIESFSKSLEYKVKERTAELAILYEVSNAISYTLDYQTLLKLIMESLFKIVDYDICASLLFDAHTVSITLRPAYAGSVGFVDQVKDSLIDSVSMLTGENIRKKHLSTFLIPTAFDANPKEGRKFDELRSFFNVPFVVRGKTLGMINVSSCKEGSFTEDNIKLIYTIANQASNAIERLQAVITAEKSKMESMVESMAEGVLMIDELGEIVVLNPQARKMLGFNFDEEVINRSLNDKLAAVGLSKTIEESKEKKRLVTKEIIVYHNEESQVLSSDITPVKNGEGEVIGIVTILRDITKEKEMDRMKTEFISTVSHELRTPLTTMKEFASIISDEIPGKLTKDQKEYVDIIKGNIDRLARLINDLLNISKIEAGKEEFKKTLVDIASLVKTTISSLKPNAEEKHIGIEVLFPGPLPGVYVDGDKIIQIFTNLIGNAVKFTPEGGKITIEVKDKEKEIECSVADTGKGIARDDLSRLFTKFQQFGRTAGTGAKGTGLGLAITKELVKGHNGKIWAESEFGRGSKFIFTLPKYTPEELLKEYINSGIKEADKKNSSLSLILVSVLEFDSLKRRIPGQKLDFILKDMGRLIKYSLRRDEDAVFGEAGEIIVFLEGCERENALKAQGRLEQALNDYLLREKLEQEIKLRFGCATYPDNGKTDAELFKKARE